jgi:GDP-4-dehydro-6-deoxy-D-mannose reductase
MARIFVTGARGFVGSWLTQDLEAAGHETVALKSGVDVRDRLALAAEVTGAGPIDAIAHLAAVAYGPDAAADTATAYATAVQGTLNLLEIARSMQDPPAVLVTGSGEVYGAPEPDQLPLTEETPLNPRSPYGLSKVAQEAVALEYANRYGVRVVVTRSFNHTGPGQRAPFVVPALARRIMAFANGEKEHVRVGNIDVRRDFCDVRDVVRAYRLLIESATVRGFGRGGAVVNVCSGSAVSIRWIGETLSSFAGVPARFWVDPELVRGTDAPEIYGTFTPLTAATGWRPQIALEQTLRDVWDEAAANPDSAAEA